jgi:hypothetical protein
MDFQEIEVLGIIYILEHSVPKTKETCLKTQLSTDNPAKVI